MSQPPPLGEPAAPGRSAQGYFLLVSPAESRAAIDLPAAIRTLVRRIVWIALGAFAGAALAACYAFFATPVYRAEALVSIVEDDSSGLGNLVKGQLGGLASLAGIDVGGAAKSRREEMLARLKSRSLVREFVERENLLPVIFHKKWDAGAKKWKAEYADDPPSLDDGVEVFTRAIRTVSEDRRTGLVTVRVEWRDPEVAARWANGLVTLADAEARQLALAEANRSVEYLDRELARTGTLEVRQGIFTLLEATVKRRMLANVKLEYGYKIVDRAVAADPERFVRPRRGLTIVLGWLFGLMISVLAVLWRHREALVVRADAGVEFPK